MGRFYDWCLLQSNSCDDLHFSLVHMIIGLTILRNLLSQSAILKANPNVDFNTCFAQAAFVSVVQSSYFSLGRRERRGVLCTSTDYRFDGWKKNRFFYETVFFYLNNLQRPLLKKMGDKKTVTSLALDLNFSLPFQLRSRVIE